MIFLFLILLLTAPLHAQLSSGASLSNITIGQVTPLSIATSSCPGAIEGNAYTCTLVATGGTIPYSWTLLSRRIRYLPAGLTLSSSGIISGTPTSTGASNFVAQVQDASAPAQTATVSIGINVVSASACGYPHYNCARDDWQTQSYDSMTTIPPDMGCQTEQTAYIAGTVNYKPCATINHCTAGADGHLQSCGNLYGLNTVVTDPNYHNAVIIRASDINDFASGCPPQIGPGGAAGFNIFDITSNYFVVSCGGGTSRLKWFNPTAQQIVTTRNKMGYVVTSTNATFSSVNSLRASHLEPYKFYSTSSAGVTVSYTITDGVISDPSAPLIDYGYAVPCWRITCNAWQHTTYDPGANILPTNNNASPPHSFQLVNEGACTTGTSEPNWLPATVDGPGGSAANSGLPTAGLRLNSVYVMTDGSCQWADMGNPAAGIKTTAGPGADLTDKYFHLGFSNRGGQDGRGFCYVAVYDSNLGRYSHWNVCTGNVYNTTCNGGTGYNCAGGSFVQTFMGNTYYMNSFPAGRNASMNIHSSALNLNAQWVEVTINYCSFWDLLANTGVRCLSTLSNPNGGFNVYYWHPFSTQLRNSYDFLTVPVIPTSQIGPGCCPGHDLFGNNRYVWRATSMYQGVNYPVTDFSTSTTPVLAFDISKAPAGGQCTPNTCWTTGSRIIRPVNWDQHSSWASNDGSDQTPPCTELYTASGGFNDSSSFVPAGGTAWPPRFPWISEIVCFAVDGSNRVARQAYTWNSGSSWRFNTMFQIGSLANDGGWWAWTSDWWCTLGSEGQGATPPSTNTMCAPFYQVLHTYQTEGEFVTSNTGNSTSRTPVTFQVTVPGTTTRDNVSWCNTAGCTITNGTVMLTRVGQNTAASSAQSGQASIFLVKLQ